MFVKSFTRKTKSGKRSKVKAHSRSKLALKLGLGGATLLGLGIGGKRLLSKKTGSVISSPEKLSPLQKILNNIDGKIGEKVRKNPKILSDQELGKNVRLEIVNRIKNKFKS